MPIQQRLVIAIVALGLTVTVFELVRKRRLREEYSWLWLLAGVGIVLASFIPMGGLRMLAWSMGSENPPAAIFFLGFCVLTGLCLQFSVRLSRMTEQLKNLGQKVALLELQLDEAHQQQQQQQHQHQHQKGALLRGESDEAVALPSVEPVAPAEREPVEA